MTLSFPMKSPVSQMGPTISKTDSLSDISEVLTILWNAPYNDGRIRSFIAASIIAKFLSWVFFTYSTLVKIAPASAIITLPGSNRIFKSLPLVKEVTTFA